MAASSSKRSKRGLCPVCLSRVRLDASIGNVVHCQCGASLFRAEDGRLVASLQQEPPEIPDQLVRSSQLAKSIRPDSTSETNREQRKDRGGRKRKANPLLIWAIASTVLLIMSVVAMVLMRQNQRAGQVAKRLATEQQAISPQRIPDTIKPGTFEQLMSQVPAPASSVEPAEKELPIAADETGKAMTQTPRPAAYLEVPPPPEVTLPDRVPARQRIELAKVEVQRTMFRDLYDQAYEHYEALMAMGEKSAESEAYRKQLAATLTLTQDAYQFQLQQSDSQNLAELRYLLAFLSLRAGHLAEAMVYGQHAVAFGDPQESSTRDAAFIVLAAAQEASETHWGIATEVGELDQMRSMLLMIDQKWPGDPQRDELWLNLAQRYQAFGKFESAAAAFEQISEGSKGFGEASVQAGMAYWQQYRVLASREGKKSQLAKPALERAKQRMMRGIADMEAELDSPTTLMMSGKFVLARIAGIEVDRERMIEFFDQGKFPLSTSMTARAKHPASQVKVSEAFLRSVFELKRQVLVSQNDSEGAIAVLEQLAKRLSADDASQLKSLYHSAAVKVIQQLLSEQSINQNDIERLDKTISQTQRNNTVSLNDQLWIADSIATLASRATTPELSKRCYQRADQLANKALQGNDVPPGMLKAIQLRQLTWLTRAGKTQRALEMALVLLSESPNVIDLQRQAVMLLESQAIANDSVDQLRVAMNGDAPKSPIWGWARLAASLQQIRYTQGASGGNRESLYEAHFHLARCRWILAQVSPPSDHHDSWANQLKRQKAAFNLIIPPGDSVGDRWRQAMAQLN